MTQKDADACFILRKDYVEGFLLSSSSAFISNSLVSGSSRY